MVRVSNVTKKLARATYQNKNYGYIWVIVIIFLLAIILFAIFFPQRFHQQTSSIIPENFETYDALMENLDDGDDTEDFANSNDPVLVMFYAPWCGHCQVAKPEFQKLMSRVNSGGRKKAIMINADENKEIARAHNVQGYPTIKYYPRGMNDKNSSKEYSGPRTVDGWLSFMN